MRLPFRLARRLNPISQPLVLSLPDFRIGDTQPASVYFSPLEQSVLDSVATIKEQRAFKLNDFLTVSTVERIDTATTLEKPRSLEFSNFLDAAKVTSISEFIECLLPPPLIETIFEPLVHPRITGKSYEESVEEDKAKQIAFTFDTTSTCRHGLLQDLCTFCRNEREKHAAKQRLRGQKKPPTVDVFEQLRYILQPPILKPSGQPTIFPNGNRPYAFQIEGVDWLVRRKEALLADEMGLGKTIQAIIAMRVLFRKGKIQRALVVCPASLTINWERELKSWAPDLRALRIHGSKNVRKEAWRAPSEVCIVSYETLANDADDIPAYSFDHCVLDEVQKIKNPTTKNHKAVKKLNPKWRWALSGTPIENSIDDAIAIFSVLVPELFGGTYWESSTETVRKRIAPYTLRRSIEDSGLDLPELIHQEHWLELTDSQRLQYNAVEDSGVEEIRTKADSATRIHVFALISKLKQICNYDEDSEESCKLEFLKERLEELAAKNEKALVFSQYPIKTLRQIEPELQEFRPLFFDGTLSATTRDDVIQTFQDNKVNQVLLISIKAGGTGLTLTRANHVFHFDHWWNPAVVDQGTARIFRIGQHKPVFTHSLYASDTIEERIAQILARKRQTFEAVFGTELDDKAMERLTDEDLFGLFDLKPPDKKMRDEEAAQVRPVSRPPRPAPPSPRENKKFADMTPVEFEEAICALFEHWGYRLSLTQRTRDGGVDLDGYSMGMGGERVIVQCKRYSGTVGVGVVRELFGVISADNSISKGFVVTTGSFSQDAKEFEKGKRITLIDGNYLTFLSSITSD